MKYLTWSQFDEAVHRIAKMFKGQTFNGVYGFPRGGLCLAVALSHHLCLPLLDAIEPGCLVVDDIYETGLTMSQACGVEGCQCVVWISKTTPTWWKAVDVNTDPEWIVFPWENPAQASTDKEAYHASRQ